MVQLQKLPVVGPLLFKPTIHLTIFWTMSGFLLQCALEKWRVRNGVQYHLSIKDYIQFLLNRLLRIYPLYIPICLNMYFSGHSRGADLSDQAKCWNLWGTLLFRLPPHRTVNCSGAGWSMSVDVQGYVVLLLMSALFSPGGRTHQPRRHQQRVIWMAWYALSLVLSFLSLQDLDPDGRYRKHVLEYGSFGRENLRDFEQQAFDPEGLLLATTNLPANGESSWTVAVRTYIHDWEEHVYYTSVHKHGSAMMLGSLLYWNHHRMDSHESFSSFWWSFVVHDKQWLKVAVAVLLLYWTSAQPCYSGLSVYLLLDVLLSLDARQPKPWFLLLVANPLWSSLAPYMYGVYLSHSFILMQRSTVLFPKWLSKKENCLDYYHWSFLLGEAIRTFAKALALSILFHHTVELPFSHVRRRWLQPSSSSIGR